MLNKQIKNIKKERGRKNLIIVKIINKQIQAKLEQKIIEERLK